MKRIKLLPLILFALLCLIFAFSGCGADNTPDGGAHIEEAEDKNEADDNQNGENSGDDKPDITDSKEEDVAFMYIYCGNSKLEIELADTVSAKALVKKLKTGDVTITMTDYGGFEKVGYLGFPLDSADENITTETGDVMLYNSNNIVIFYASNRWDYTRIGKINGVTKNSLKEFFSENTVKFSLR